VAEHISDSVRELEGVVNSLVAYSVVWNRDIDLNMAEIILKRAVKNEKKAITIDHILETTCKFFDVKQEDIFTSSLKQNIVQVRQIAMFLSQKYTNHSYARIGAQIGKRNHATVLHSCKQVEDRMQVDKSFKAKIEELEALLKKKQ
jgi:chromosomal replication initiator protein